MIYFSLPKMNFLTYKEISQKLSKEIKFNIPLINNKNFNLFIINGNSQSFKTTVAIDLLNSTFNSIIEAEAIWIDCSLKFPIEVLIKRNINLNRLKVVQCKSSEDLLFIIKKIEFLMENNNNNNNLKLIIFDDLNTNFWIDKITKNNLFNLIKNSIEKLSSFHGLLTIITIQDIGDFQIWNSSQFCSIQFLTCEKVRLNLLNIKSNSLCDQFLISNNKELIFKENC